MSTSYDIQSCLANIKNQIAPNLRFRNNVWTIHIWGGSSPFELAPLSTSKGPMLSAEQVADVDASYVADPFMVNEGDRWYMFFEVLERSSRQGIISVAMSDDSYSWTYGGVVLREDFHLSYPCVFKSDGTYYMVPETAEAEAVRLYRSTDFPMQWSLAGELFPGAHRDPSIVHFNGLWWLFTCNTEHGANALQLHFAAELMGEWTEHPSSPLISHNPHITRPGGRILRYNDRLYRIAQDTVPVYGLQLFAFEILELSTDSYVERLVGDGPFLRGKRKAWYRERIHHMDAHQIGDGSWIAAIDQIEPTWRPRFE
jgi:hypothetical protein